MAFNCTITKTGQCPSGGHINLAITGDKTATRTITLAEVREGFQDGELDMFLVTYLKLYALGKTNGQLNTAFTSGVAVSIG